MPKPLPPLQKGQSSDSRRPVVRVLERAAAEMNPFLTILAIGIAILDVTCFAGIVGTRHLVSNVPKAAITSSAAASTLQPLQ